MKNPAFLFYPGDWLKDAALRSVSHTAKGVWMDLLCLMYECEPKGVLISNGKSWTVQDIIKAIGGDPRLVRNAVQELLVKGVAKRRADGAIYSKRMVLDEEFRADNRNRKQNERSVALPQSQLSHGDVTASSHGDVTEMSHQMSQTLSVSGTVTVQREEEHARDKTCDGEETPTGKGPPIASPNSDDAAIPSVEEVCVKDRCS